MPQINSPLDLPRDSTNWVRVGTVTGIHGHEGNLRVDAETDNPNRFIHNSILNINNVPYRIQSAIPANTQRSRFLLKLWGVNSRDDAASLLHQIMFVDAHDTPPLPDGTYYHYQLLDMMVVNHSNEYVGRLTEVISTGQANDVYVITSDESEIIIPAIVDFVKDVNLEQSVTGTNREGIGD